MLVSAPKSPDKITCLVGVFRRVHLEMGTRHPTQISSGCRRRACAQVEADDLNALLALCRLISYRFVNARARLWKQTTNGDPSQAGVAVKGREHSRGIRPPTVLSFMRSQLHNRPPRVVTLKTSGEPVLVGG